MENDGPREKIDKYVTTFIYFLTPLTMSWILPILPVGGNYIIPIVSGAVLSLLIYRKFVKSAKFLLTYFIFFTILIQSIFTYSLSNIPYYGEFIILIIIIVIAVPIVAYKADPLLLGFGALSGSLLINPATLPLSLSIMMIYTVYKRNVFNTVAMVFLALMISEPFVLAATYLNAKSLAFYYLKLGYVHLSSSQTFQNILNNVTFVSFNSISNPIYLLGQVTSINTEFRILGLLFHSSLPNNFSIQNVSNSFLIAGNFLIYFLVAIILAVAFSFSVEGMNILMKILKKINAMAEVFQPLIFAIILSLLTIYLISSMSIPLVYLTSVGFSMYFLVYTVGVSAAGGLGVTINEVYIKRAEEIEMWKTKIKEVSGSFVAEYEMTIDKINLIKQNVREREYTYETMVNTLNTQFKEEIGKLNEISIESLRIRYRNVSEFLSDLRNMHRQLEDDTLNYVRLEAIKYNNLLAEAKKVSEVNEGSVSESFNSLPEALSLNLLIHKNTLLLSREMISFYDKVSSSLNRLFPDEVFKLENPKESELIIDLENLLEAYIKPIVNGIIVDKFDKYKNDLCLLIDLKPEIYNIRNMDIFINDLQKKIENEIDKLNKLKSNLAELNTTLSSTLKINTYYSSILVSSSAISIIDDEIQKLKQWKDIEQLLSIWKYYKEKALPEIENDINMDKITIYVLSIYSLIEMYFVEELASKDRFNINDVPLSYPAAEKMMQIFVRSHGSEYSFSEKMKSGTIEKYIEKRGH
ncbi:MAG: hypothetical protein QXZ12_08465 [Thermoplasmata archaeon]